MRSVNPQPGEYKYALTLGPGKGGMRRETAQGWILYGGIFGLCEYIDGWHMTHLGTGRRVGGVCGFPTRRKAYEAAAQLAALDLPWDAKSNKEWNVRRKEKPTQEAIEIIEHYERR